MNNIQMPDLTQTVGDDGRLHPHVSGLVATPKTCPTCSGMGEIIDESPEEQHQRLHAQGRFAKAHFFVSFKRCPECWGLTTAARRH